jgi:hypothetical protein
MKKHFLFYFLFISVLSTNCSKEPSKEKDGIKNPDYLFLDVFFDMTRKEFYDYCWDMNKKKIFTHGTGNTSVQYRLENELKEPVFMRFYPSFHEDKIYEMPVTFTYDKWAPWNKQYWSDKLLEDLLVVFKKWYGDDFQLINHPTQGKIYAKIDKYRRINLFIRDDQFVQVVYTDMRKVKEVEKKALEALEKEEEKK